MTPRWLRLNATPLALLLLMSLAMTPAAADTLVVTPIALQGQAAPAGGRFRLFGEIDVDPIRRVTISASLTSGQVGIFRTSFGVLQPVVLSGDPAPPDAGNRFAVPLGVAGNRRGDLAFFSTLFFPDRWGVFLMSDGVTRTLALEGTPVPGSVDLQLGGFDQIRMLDSGEVYVVSDLYDGSGEFAGRALLAHDGSGLRAVIAPGDRYGGTRKVNSVLQYDVNEDGDVAALIEVGDALLEGTLTEIVQSTGGGPLRILASAFLSFGGGTDQIRHFAVSIDQVGIDPMGAVSFFTATDTFPGGGYAVNTSGRLSNNAWLVRQRDPSPLAPGDTYQGFAAFGRAADGTMAFHVGTLQAQGGGILVVRPPQGPDLVAARAGAPRPGGGTWIGFRRIGMNDAGAFVFTEFGGLIQTGVFLGRLVRPPEEILDAIAARLDDPELAPSVANSLKGLLRPMEGAVRRGDLDRAILLAESMRREIAARAGRSIPLGLAEEIDALLDDLAAALAQAAS